MASNPAAEAGARRAASPHADALLDFLHALSLGCDQMLIDAAGDCLLDTVGVMALGCVQPWGRIVRTYVLEEGTQGACSLLGHSGTAAAGGAALSNGTAAHGFELDDLLSAAIIHPGAVVVPAVLAAAESSGASGLALLRGIVAGYEATARISLALGTEPSQRGFHKTSVVGPVSGAIGAAVTMGLSPEQLRWAVGLACSCAAGVKNFAAGGAGMVKRFHAGHAAEAAVRAASLARLGFTAPLHAIDGPFGLIDAFGGSTGRADLLDAELGSVWALDDVWVKVFPICGWIQGVAQSLLEMRRRADFDADAIEQVTVATSSFAVKYNANFDPADTMDAQYSIPYCTAVALTGDPVDPAEYSSARISDPSRGALMRKVRLQPDRAADEAYPAHFVCEVTVTFTDGRIMRARTNDAHGTPADPCTSGEKRSKFAKLMALSGLGIDADAVVSSVERLRKDGAVGALSASLRLRS